MNSHAWEYSMQVETKRARCDIISSRQSFFYPCLSVRLTQLHSSRDPAHGLADSPAEPALL